MKKRFLFITFLVFFVSSGCVFTPPVKHPQYTESNLPKVYKINAVPYIRQGNMQCFPTCLYMIFKFYGKEIPLQEIDDWIRGARGTSTQAAEQYCNMRGFKTYVFYDRKGDKIKYFLSQGYPLIVYVQTGAFGTRFHVIVLTGYDDEKQVFYMNDPGKKGKEISYKEFKEIRSVDQPGEHNKYYTLLIWPPTSETKVLHTSTTEISTLTIPPQGVEIINKPRWVEGDTWVCQTDKGKFIRQVEKVDSSGIILKQGESRFYYDDNFALIKRTLKERTVYEYNPPYKGALFFPLWVGKRWRNEFTEKNLEKGTIYNFTELFGVKGWEDIQTAAGVLKTLKIEINQENLETRGSWTYTLWYSPQVKNYVKSSSEHLKERNWILAEFSLSPTELISTKLEELWPWLGISAKDGKDAVLVLQVYPGTSAEKAGLASGDIIKSVDDNDVKNVNELTKEIQKIKVGQKVKLKIIRDAKEMTVEVRLYSRPIRNK